MADIVYLYPKTSCPCQKNSNCSSNGKEQRGFRSNLSLRDCEYPKCYETHDRIYMNQKSQPLCKQGIVALNPQVYSQKYDPSFGKVPCKKQGCNNPTYLSQDPRLYSVTLADYIPLDAPPINGNVKLKDIYDKKWDNYGACFQPYEKIRDGQIEYYVDKSIEDPYFSPLYADKSKEVAVLYKDPMDAIKPEYTRIPLTNTQNPTTSCRDSYPCLSFIEDTQSFREDIMSYQMRKRLQQKWETRWSQ